MRPLEQGRYVALVAKLAAWREVLAGLDVIGQDPRRYEGAAYGNVSARIGPFPGARGQRPFLVSGTQTGGLACVSVDDFCAVAEWSTRENRVASRGSVLPSSESLTHATIYDLSPAVRFVLHVHAPAIFERARELRLPTTKPTVAYGTPEMAEEVARLYRETTLEQTRVLVMGGHEDGVIAFGKTADEAGHALLSLHARARELTLLDDGRLCRT